MQGPGSIRHSGGKCIHVLLDTFNKPKEGQFLVTYEGCAKDRLEFQLWPNGTLMLTRHSMCVKPTDRMTDGVKVGVFSSWDATDTWSWTAQESLQYKKKMCLQPETGGVNPRNGIKLVLDSVCDERQNFFEFVPTSGWYLYIEALPPRQPNDKARLISPSTIETKSCLLFFYHMFGHDMGKLQVYVKSGGRMYSVWSRSGEQGVEWYQAQVAVNNQMALYQFVIEGVRGKGDWGDIAIDDISLMVSCPPRDKGTDDFSKIIMIAITLGFSVFVNIVLIVLWIKYKLLKRASKLSTPVNIPLETNEISPEPLPVDEEACHETVTREFYDDFGTSGSESEGPSAEGRTSDYEEVEVPSNAHQASGHTELNKRPDTSKRVATGDGDYQAFLKDVDIIDTYIIPIPEEPQHETSGQNETCEEPKLSPENPVCTELDDNRVHGRNTTGDGTHQKQVKRDSDYVIPPAYERRESYEDI
ncbi:MAM and LDL-receptor class A domain-containing 1-like [Paramuricea clavata]|uniref:MAM and LDL-receptor class A domain-containing 1-like n=1 Tax=Paramuricea clavata TaxID=317549 RepID=A0A7D9DNE8_PARCT|nr:MAM and LDL-receptor class A domain-containing 1-like [Paramuricea clavata]